jgi:ABC-type sulfate/molybdate transport systems ATPase subunit
MRSLLQQLLAELEIPAAHVTHDRDEALSIGDDLAVIVGGRLRQTGPAASVAAGPADPDVARLLGWSELGRGTASDGTLHLGRLMLREVAAKDLHGAVEAFYRPEDIELTSRTPDEAVGDGLAAHVGRILRTRPLARITLDCDPPITALMLHKEVDRLRLTDGDPVAVNLPPGSLHILPADA